MSIEPYSVFSIQMVHNLILLLPTISHCTIFGPSATQAAGMGPPASCSFTQGVAVVGSIITAVKQASQHACCEACFRNPNCLAATLTADLCTLHANATDTTTSTDSAAAVSVREAGSVHQGGRYGEWRRDADGLPTYVYTLNQLIDHPADGPINQPDCNLTHRVNCSHRWAGVPPPIGFGSFPNGTIDRTARGEREHSFQLGNDRVVLVGSNYGTFRLRQDEGGPKWLTDADADAPKGHLHGGGFGYLFGKDQTQILTTAYTGTQERVFGIGYARTTVATPLWKVEHTVAVPPGNLSSQRANRDMFLSASSVTIDIAYYPSHSRGRCTLTTACRERGDGVCVQVNITNIGTATREVTWVEVWGTGMVHLLTGKGWGGWAAKDGMSSLTDRRIFANRHYSSTFTAINKTGIASAATAGMVQSRTFTGLTDKELAFCKDEFIGRAPIPPRASLWDTQPPAVFLSVVDPMNTKNTIRYTSFGNDAKQFFGSGGRANPGGKVILNQSVPEGNTGLLAATMLTLPAGKSAIVRYVFGYALSNNMSNIDAIISTASQAFKNGDRIASGVAGAVRRAWRPHLFHFEFPHRPFLRDELLWHSFYLAAATSYDTYFNESIVDQGTAYRYHAGFQGAIRDPLQHVLPLVHTRPDLVKSVLRYSLKERQPTPFYVSNTEPVGFPDSIIGSGVVRPNTPRPDDFEMYLLWTVSEYVLGTKDTMFLTEPMSPYNTTRMGATVLDTLIAAFNFTYKVVGTGPHGLLRLLTSDWDDGFKPPPDAEIVAESVLTSALAAFVLPRFASTLKLVGDDTAAAVAAQAIDLATKLGTAIRSAAWNGKWLRRAWLGLDAGWAGDIDGYDPGVYSSPVGWALLGNVFDAVPTQRAKAVAAVLNHCRDDAGWRYGFGYRCSKPYPYAAGSGSWPAQNHPFVMGLLRAGMSDLALEEFERNSMQWFATVSPATWIGIWTAGDTIRIDGLPGRWTWDFPALCTHPHAYPLLSAAALAGVEFSAAGVIVTPMVPGGSDVGTTISTPLFTLSASGTRNLRNGERIWTGIYRPSTAGRWAVAFDSSRLNRTWCKNGIKLSLSSADLTETQWTTSNLSVATLQVTAMAPQPTTALRFHIVCPDKAQADFAIPGYV